MRFYEYFSRRKTAAVLQKVYVLIAVNTVLRFLHGLSGIFAVSCGSRRW